MKKEKTVVLLPKDAIMIAFIFVMLAILFVLPVSAAQLDPITIPKWENTITGPPPVYVNVSKNYYEVSVTEFDQPILPPPLPKTSVYGYGGLAKDAVTGQSLGFVRNSPGPTFEAKTGVPIKVKFINDLTQPHMFTIDKTIMWADPETRRRYQSVSTSTAVKSRPHLTAALMPGGRIPVTTAASTIRSSRLLPDAAVFDYPNSQEPATLWYHDHALGMTRLNVVGGMAGFYLLRDNKDKVAPGLPEGQV